ncbi:LysR family transcriptional regulator [Virgibacillus ndiopensis]|uniref:LysR family transcriptional regulator n=1 Tax=Virgibacillus ndiopensis TaxID=2004408 RepID=UPI000C06FAC5|nr:LysR family transcriptional regulator [Virgibacillus ndiopensis]
MNEKDWELLLTLYKEGTITSTAQKLYISQPALTYRIKQIEKGFQAKIIYRGNKGVVFTTQGLYLVEYAQKMVNELRKTKDKIRNMEDEVQGILRLGVSSNFALYQLPVLLEGFLSKYPNVEINLTTGWSSKILTKLQSEEVHIAILRGEHNWTGEQLILNQETLCVASKDIVDLEELPNLNLIKYQTDFHLKNTFDQWWQNNYTTPPNVTMEVDRIETCKELVKKGIGYAIFPSISLKDEDNLFTIDLEENDQKILRKTWLLHRKELLELNIIHAFVTFMKDFYGIKQ